MITVRPVLITLSLFGLAVAGCIGNQPLQCPANTVPGDGGCIPSYPPGSHPPSISPGALPSGTGQYSDPGITISGGGITTRVVDSTGKALKGAVIRAYGLTMASTATDASGQATLGPLAVGTGYRLIVSADGYATQQLDGIEVVKQKDTSEQAQLGASATVTGTVTGPQGPLGDVVVSDGLNSTLTDANGHYTLKGCAAGGQLTLTAAKSRFQTSTRSVSMAGTAVNGQDLSLTATQPVVYFDSTVPSGIPVSHFSTMQKALTDAGWQIIQTPPTRDGVWVVSSPSKALPAELVTRVSSFVAQGGKLVLLGEWGGYGSVNNPGFNTLAHAVGLHFDPDLLRDPGGNKSHPEWLTVTSFQSGISALSGVSTLKLYAACSVFGLDPMSVWARTSTTGYRVQDNAVPGSQPVVVAGPFKGGKAIAIGDCSAFSDDSTEGTGGANINQGNNLQLVTQLFNW